MTVESTIHQVQAKQAGSRPRLQGEALVVICAANNWDSTFVADQHVASRLARTVPVLYVDPPLSRLTPRNRPELQPSLEGPRLRGLAPNLIRYTPVVQPGPERPGVIRLTSALLRHRLRRITRQIGLPVHAMVSAWPLHGLENASGERVTAFWAQDDFAGGAELLGLDGERLAAGEALRVERADVVIAANPAVAERWRSAGRDVELIPYGCDAERFAHVDVEPPAADVRLDGPIAGVIGQFNARTDLGLLEAVAGRGRSLLLVGPLHDGLEPGRFERLTALPNVQWVGPRPFTDLAGYLRVMTVGLVPYADTAFNRGSFPLKTLEYLAAGRRVVATELPATRWLGTPLLVTPDGPEAFADAVDAALSEPLTEDERAQRRRFAAAHSWDVRVAAIGRALGLA